MFITTILTNPRTRPYKGYCLSTVSTFRLVWACPWISKNGCYEHPYIVTGDMIMHDWTQA